MPFAATWIDLDIMFFIFVIEECTRNYYFFFYCPKDSLYILLRGNHYQIFQYYIQKIFLQNIRFMLPFKKCLFLLQMIRIQCFSPPLSPTTYFPSIQDPVYSQLYQLISVIISLVISGIIILSQIRIHFSCNYEQVNI